MTLEPNCAARIDSIAPQYFQMAYSHGHGYGSTSETSRSFVALTSQLCSKSEAPCDELLLPPDDQPSVATSSVASETSTKATEICVPEPGDHQMGAPLPVPGTQTSSNVQRSRLGALPSVTQRPAIIATAITYGIANTDFVHPVIGHKRLYVGSEDVVKPSPQCEHEWERKVKLRLQEDIEAFKQNVKKKMKMEPDVYPRLRMSGYKKKGMQDVTLLPQTWIIYSDSDLKRKVERFAKKALKWLPEEGHGDPIVAEGPRFGAFDAVSTVTVALEQASAFQISKDLFLHLHCEGGEPVSPCGLMCCATISRNGEVRSQRLFRIGGLISVNGALRGLTTAHGMLEEFWTGCILDEDAGKDRYDDIDEIDWDGSDSGSISSTSDDEEAAYTIQQEEVLKKVENPWNDQIGSTDAQAVKVWNVVSAVEAVNFMGISAPNLMDVIRTILSGNVSTRENPVSTETTTSLQRPDSDVSVWQMESSQVPDRNIYYTKNGSDQIENHVNEPLPDDPASRGSVQILIRWDNPIECKLVPGTSHFRLYGRDFETRKIRTPSPICKFYIHFEYYTQSY